MAEMTETGAAPSASSSSGVPAELFVVEAILSTKLVRGRRVFLIKC
jgi:hypothetical protein